LVHAEQNQLRENTPWDVHFHAVTPPQGVLLIQNNATADAATPTTATGPTKDFTEDDVNAAVKKVVDTLFSWVRPEVQSI
jgi:hypothetical protein